MRFRLLATAASVTLAALVAPTSHAAVPTPTVVTFDGQLGHVSIDYKRLSDLVDVALTKSTMPAAEAFLDGLSVDEQRAVHYAMNPALADTISDLPPCPTEDCDPPAPAEQPKAEVHPAQSTAPPGSPPAPTATCETPEATVEVHSVIGNRTELAFTQHLYFCWDRFTVSGVSGYGTYKINWPFWHCLGQEDGYPLNVTVPLTDAPFVKDTTTGECVYSLHMTLPFVGPVEVGTMERQLTISTVMHANGAWQSVME